MAQNGTLSAADKLQLGLSLYAYKLAPIKAMIIIIGEFIKQLSSLLLIRDHKTMQHTRISISPIDAMDMRVCELDLYKEPAGGCAD